MTGWRVELSKPAQRELRQLEDGPQRDAIELLQDLRDDPNLVPAIEMRANPDVWRARFHHNRYRVIYQIAKARRLIIVRRIRPRVIAYKGMKH